MLKKLPFVIGVVSIFVNTVAAYLTLDETIWSEGHVFYQKLRDFLVLPSIIFPIIGLCLSLYLSKFKQIKFENIKTGVILNLFVLLIQMGLLVFGLLLVNV